MPRPRKPASPFRYFNSSPEVIRLAVLMYVKYPLSLRNAEDLLHERGIDICHETVRFWWNRIGPLFAADIRRQRVNQILVSLTMPYIGFPSYHEGERTASFGVAIARTDGDNWREAAGHHCICNGPLSKRLRLEADRRQTTTSRPS